MKEARVRTQRRESLAPTDLLPSGSWPSPPPRILIVEDDAEMSRTLAQLFAGCATHFACTAEDGLAAIAEFDPELVLLDVMLPGMDGFEACRRIKADPEHAGLPVIFLTGIDRDMAERRGLALGAADFVAKPVNALVLQRRAQIQVELVRARAELLRQAATDALTGLANRREFDRRLEVEHARLARQQLPLALLLVDIDHFKAYNDCYGHLQGDDCLRAVANALATCVYRPADLVGRYGGEEFACILPETDAAGARTVATRMLEGLAQLALPHRDAPAGVLTMSIGAAAAVCTRRHSLHALLSAADRQLYLAKSRGRGRLAVSVSRRLRELRPA